MSLTQLDSKTEEVDPIPRNIFERILKVSHRCGILRFVWIDDLDA